MFVPLGPLLTASSAQQACQALQAPMPPVAASSDGSNPERSGALPLASRQYAHPIDGACPLTGGEGSDLADFGLYQLRTNGP